MLGRERRIRQVRRVTIAGCKRLVCFGGKSTQHSHRHIWEAYQRTALKLGLQAAWVDDTKDGHNEIRAGDLVMCIDVWSEHLAPAVHGARYVLHNFGPEHEVLWSTLGPKQFLRLQVWTYHAHGERIGSCRYWCEENRTLQQPWGTDLLAEEFYEPAFNSTSRDAVFVGAVWNTDGQGNEPEIDELRAALKSNGLRFVHRTQIGAEEAITLTRAARMAPAIAGAWQVANGYLPCRVFKNVSYGQLAITNVGRFYDLFTDCSLQSETIPELVVEAMSLKRGEWADMVLCQQKVVAQFTYRESLAAIDKVFS